MANRMALNNFIQQQHQPQVFGVQAALAPQNSQWFQR